ncbi:MAG: DUF2442 domain-containing protein [Planctomycetota bacterium]|jgi:hypothetical protein|nr:DUF2442 domain-containing protein [Planctomycetota bacterium]
MLRPNIFQVAPQDDYTVLVYFDDGQIRRYDARRLIDKGGIYACLSDIVFFKNRCVVLNRTLAWDVTGNFDPTNCLDVCPDVIYESGKMTDDFDAPLAEFREEKNCEQ